MFMILVNQGVDHVSCTLGVRGLDFGVVNLGLSLDHLSMVMVCHSEKLWFERSDGSSNVSESIGSLSVRRWVLYVWCGGPRCEPWLIQAGSLYGILNWERWRACLPRPSRTPGNRFQTMWLWFIASPRCIIGSKAAQHLISVGAFAYQLPSEAC